MTAPVPVLHLLAGPNGAGKTTFYEQVLAPVVDLDFVNADLIAAHRWPEDPMTHAHEAAAEAAAVRERLIESHTSFIAETVFSHPSKVDLVRRAADAGYLVYLHVLIVPEDLAVQRVAQRVADGGHDVPESKVRQRHARLWRYVADAIADTYAAVVYDSSSRGGESFVLVAQFRFGTRVGPVRWPTWAPDPLRHPSTCSASRGGLHAHR